MADRLRSCANMEEALECAVRLYSASSFLYNLINSVMRNEDESKLETLGPFFYLLWSHVVINSLRNGGEETVYRGCTLTKEMVEEYRQVIGTYIAWPAFTSTSKSREVAEMFTGNTLFVIRIHTDICARYCDISLFSRFPQEEEILLITSVPLEVKNVEHDLTTGTYRIYLDDDYMKIHL